MSYKEAAKKAIVDHLRQIDPHEMILLEEKIQQCDQCGENEYLFYPSYKYGRCTECGYEEGYELYVKRIEEEVKQYHRIKKSVEDVLNKIK